MTPKTISQRTLDHYEQEADALWEGTKDHDVSQNYEALLSQIEGEGPFTLLDFVGLDTTYYIANIMFDEFREKRFAPPPLLKRLVLAGHHGKKTGRGFYDHSDPSNPRALF